MDSWGERILAVIDSAPGRTAVIAPPGFQLSALERLLTEHRPQLTLHCGREVSADGLLASVTDISSLYIGHSAPRGTTFDTVVDSHFLAFSREEALALALEMGVSEDVAEAVYLMTNGWPLYLRQCLSAASNGAVSHAGEVVSRLRDGPHLQPLRDLCLTNLDPEDHGLAQKVALFRELPRSVIEHFGGPRSVERVQDGGLPLVETRPGWFEVLPPFDGLLRSGAAIDETEAASLAPVLVANVGVLRSSQILLGAGHNKAAAELLRGIAIADRDESHQEQLGPTLTTVLDFAKDDGLLHLMLARVHHNSGELKDQRVVLLRAQEAAREQLRPDLVVEASAELLMLDLPGLDKEDALARLREIESDADHHSTNHALIRLREVAEALLIQSYELGAIYESIPRVVAIANQWKLVGENLRAAATLRMLTATSHTHLGRYCEGAQLMSECCELVKSSPQALLKSFSLQTRMSALSGDLVAFAKSAARTWELLASVGVPWIEAYLSWSEMIAAGHRGDADAVGLHMRRSRSLLGAGGLIEHETGVVFYSEASRALTMCGELSKARTCLDTVRERRHESQLEYDLANFMLSCREDPTAAPQLVESLSNGVPVPIERQWLVDLEVALASGEQLCFQKVEAIRDEAAAHGLECLFDSVFKSANSVDSGHQVHIQVLGEFRVTIGNDRVDIGSEKTRQLLKFLAVRGKPVPTEVLIDHLWPDVLVDLGSRRLRNVLRRAREAIGVDGVLRIDGNLTLGPEIQIDLSEVEAGLRCFEASPTSCVADLLRAIEHYNGPVLEFDIYDDWVSPSRLGVTSRLVAALGTALEHDLLDPPTALRALTAVDVADIHLFELVRAQADRDGDVAVLRTLSALAS